MAAATTAASASLLLSPPPPPPPLLTRRKPSFFSPRRRRTRLGPIAVASPVTPTPISDEFEELEAPTLESESPSSSSSSSNSFSWRDHWYPVSLVEDLDPRLPTPNPASGLEDRCPHRLAPLSVTFSSSTKTKRKEGLMRMDACSALTMGVPSMDRVPAPESHMHHPKVPRQDPSNRQGPVWQSSQRWSPWVCSLYGRMRTVA